MRNKFKKLLKRFKEWFYEELLNHEDHCCKCKLGGSVFGGEDYYDYCNLHCGQEDFEPELMCYMPLFIKSRVAEKRTDKYYQDYMDYLAKCQKENPADWGLPTLEESED